MKLAKKLKLTLGIKPHPKFAKKAAMYGWYYSESTGWEWKWRKIA